MSESPFSSSGETSVTIKWDKGFEATWTVFRGTIPQLREQITDYFGWDKNLNLSLAALTHNANIEAKALWSVGEVFGGKVIEEAAKQASVSEVSESVEQAPAESKPDPVAQPEAKSEVDVIREQIAGIENVADLQKLWAENQAAFADGDLLATWKARGKELSS